MTTKNKQDVLLQAHAGFSVEKIETTASAEKLHSIWNSLLSLSQTKTIELTYEWQMTYWSHFNRKSKLFILVVKEFDEIIGIAPLKITSLRKYGIKIRKIEFIAAKESNYQDLIIGRSCENVIRSILDYLLIHKGKWDVLTLSHMPQDSKVCQFLLNNLSPSLFPRVSHVDKCISLNIEKSWSEYENSLSSKAMANLRNRTKRLEKLGKLESFRCVDEKDFKIYMNKFFELHRKRWRGTETPSQFKDERSCAFYLDIIPKLLPKDQIEFYVLEMAKKPLAFLIASVYNNNYLIQLIAYDIDYSKYAPSAILHHNFVKDIFIREGNVLDFGYYYPYKAVWANHIKEKLHIEIYKKGTTVSNLIYILSNIDSYIRSKLRNITPLRRLVVFINKKIGELKSNAINF